MSTLRILIAGLCLISPVEPACPEETATGPTDGHYDTDLPCR